MEKTTKFLLPSPNFDKTTKAAPKSRAHYLTPSGMTLLPREKQPPPMYGPRGATLPAAYLPPAYNKPQPEPVLPKPKLNEPQYCEPCEMELQSMDDLRRHRAQHQRCQVEGCQYRGHASVMDKHVAVMHTSGIFDKFKKLSTPEEIAAWRDERKKRYPTVANVLLRQQAQQQRQKRGERLEANKSRFAKRDERSKMQRGERDAQRQEVPKQNSEEMPDGEASKRHKKNVQRNQRRKRANAVREHYPNVKQEILKPAVVVVDTTQAEELTCTGVRMFGGTKQLENYAHMKAKKTPNVLTSLLGMYGSDNDTESSTAEETEVMEENNKLLAVAEADASQVINVTKQKEKETCEVEIVINSAITDVVTAADVALEKRDSSLVSAAPAESLSLKEGAPKSDSADEAPEETSIAKSSHIPDAMPRVEPPRKRTKMEREVAPDTEKPSQKLQNATRQQRKRQKSGLDYRKLRLRKQNTMLEKLLEGDIRHERNVLLQCVRYVCENNYFGVGQAST